MSKMGPVVKDRVFVGFASLSPPYKLAGRLLSGNDERNAMARARHAFFALRRCDTLAQTREPEK